MSESVAIRIGQPYHTVCVTHAIMVLLGNERSKSFLEQLKAESPEVYGVVVAEAERQVVIGRSLEGQE